MMQWYLSIGLLKVCQYFTMSIAMSLPIGKRTKHNCKKLPCNRGVHWNGYSKQFQCIVPYSGLGGDSIKLALRVNSRRPGIKCIFILFRGSFGDWNNKSLHYIVEPLSQNNNSVSEIRVEILVLYSGGSRGVPLKTPFCCDCITRTRAADR